MKSSRPARKALAAAGAAMIALTEVEPALAQREAGAATLKSAVSEAPVYVRSELGAARLAGQGTLRWFGLSVYDAQLWVGPGGLAVDTLGATPFVLELHYSRSLKGQAIAERSRDEIQRMGLGTPAQREQWFRRMTELFPDVKAGDTIAGVSQPRIGTRFYLNGKALGDVRDEAFTRAFFSIWFDARTVAPGLREQLLADAGARP